MTREAELLGRRDLVYETGHFTLSLKPPEKLCSKQRREDKTTELFLEQPICLKFAEFAIEVKHSNIYLLQEHSPALSPPSDREETHHRDRKDETDETELASETPRDREGRRGCTRHDLLSDYCVSSLCSVATRTTQDQGIQITIEGQGPELTLNLSLEVIEDVYSLIKSALVRPFPLSPSLSLSLFCFHLFL